MQEVLENSATNKEKELEHFPPGAVALAIGRRYNVLDQNKITDEQTQKIIKDSSIYSPDYEALGDVMNDKRNAFWKKEQPAMTFEEQCKSWRESVTGYAQKLKEDNNTKAIDVLLRFGIDITQTPEEMDKKIEDFRKKYFANGSDIEAFAKVFAGEKSLTEVIQDLDATEAFLIIFGKEEATILAKETILAYAALDEQNKETFGTIAVKQIKQPLSPEEMKAHALLRQKQDEIDIRIPKETEDKTNWSVDKWQEYLKRENDTSDLEVFAVIESLRREVEEEGKWQELKQEALKEIETLPDNVVQQIEKRFQPFIEKLKAPHGKMHFKRDLLHLICILNDPETKQRYDDVELITGALATMFHDIGNSIVERYDDALRLAQHAEVGAYLLGEITGDLIPPNLLKLTQYAIAAHTNYPVDIAVTKNKAKLNEITRIKRSYRPYHTIEGKDKAAIWLTRSADKLDLLQHPIEGVRHMIQKTLPTRDFDHLSGVFHEPDEANQIEDFQYQFNPTLFRTKEEREKESDRRKKTPTVLEHLWILADSALYGKFDTQNPPREKNEHNLYDTDYFTSELVLPDLASLKVFTDALREGPKQPMTEKEINEAFEQFYRLCEVIEPAENLPEAIERFKTKFATMSLTDRMHWANGFNILTQQSLAEWYNRLKSHMQKPAPDVSDNEKVKKIIGTIHTEANETLKNFDPAQLEEMQADETNPEEAKPLPNTLPVQQIPTSISQTIPVSIDKTLDIEENIKTYPGIAELPTQPFVENKEVPIHEIKPMPPMPGWQPGQPITFERIENGVIKPVYGFYDEKPVYEPPPPPGNEFVNSPKAYRRFDVTASGLHKP